MNSANPNSSARLVITKADGGSLTTHIVVVPATTFLRRLVGLLGRGFLPDDECLWLQPCTSIHTFGMRFGIDVVFLDQNRRVKGFSDGVKPNRIRFAPRGTVSVLELSEGNRSRTGINLDDQLNFD